MYRNTQEDWDLLRRGVVNPETLYAGWVEPNGRPAVLTCYTDPHPPVSEVRLEAAYFVRADSREEAERRWATRNYGAVVPLQYRVRELEAEVARLRAAGERVRRAYHGEDDVFDACAVMIKALDGEE